MAPAADARAVELRRTKHVRVLAGTEGIEPSTRSFGGCCSTAELRPYETEKPPFRSPGGGLLVQVGRYTTTALFVGMQLSSGSMTAAGAWKYHPRSCCLLDDLCIMILTVAERA